MRRGFGENGGEEVLGTMRRSRIGRGRRRSAKERREGRRSCAIGNERGGRRGRWFGGGILRRWRLLLRMLEVGRRTGLMGVGFGEGMLTEAGRQQIVVVTVVAGDQGVVDEEACRNGRPRFLRR